MKMRELTILTGILTGFLSAGVMAVEAGPEMESTTRTFSLNLDSTRVIYAPDSKGATLGIVNDHDYPILVQSEALMEDKKSRAPFIVTPPLFRLDGKQSSRLRIVRTGGNFPSERETLQWLCVKGVPPKEGDKWAEEEGGKAGNKLSLQVQLSINNCIKIFVRPSAVKGHPDDVAGKLEWQRAGNKLKGTNPTPFYMNLSELSVGGKRVDDSQYIAPFSSHEYTLPTGASGKVYWKVITDYGGTSKKFEAELKSG